MKNNIYKFYKQDKYLHLIYLIVQFIELYLLLLFPTYYQNSINEILTNNSDFKYIYTLLLFYVCFFIISFLLGYISEFIFFVNPQSRIYSACFEKICKLPMNFFYEKDASYISVLFQKKINELLKEVKSIFDSINLIIIYIWLLIIIFQIISIGIIVVIAFFSFHYILLKKFSNFNKKVFHNINKYWENISTQFSNIYFGFFEIKNHSKEEYFLSQACDSLYNIFINCLLKLEIKTYINMFWSYVIKGLIPATLIIISNTHLFNINLSYEQIFSFYLLYTMLPSTEKLIALNITFNKIKIFGEDIFVFLNLNEISCGKEKISHYDLEFIDVNLSLREKIIFKDLSVKIKHGEKIALVGLSGEGKSIFCEVALGLINIDSGSINIANKNISSIDKDILFENFSYATQDSYIFNDSLRNNILCYRNNNIDDKEIIQLIDIFLLNDFYNKLPKGLDTILGSNAINISGGEKNRIALIRSLISRPKVVFLDEITAGLDEESESKILDYLCLQDSTVIIITHRLSTLHKMNRFIVLENGNIVSDDNVKNMLKSNKLKNIFDLQLKHI